MKIKVSVLPLVVGMALAAISTSIPWLTANHYQELFGKKEVVDNYVYFLWGHIYKVIGTKQMLSTTTIYDYRDFPFIAMIFIAIALLLGIVSLFGGRGAVLNIRGKELKWSSKMNPGYFTLIGSAILLLAWYYMQTAPKQHLLQILEGRQYVPEFGPSLDYMLGASIAYAVATFMTFYKTNKNEAIKEGKKA